MNKPKTRNENVVVQEFENEILIYDLKINKAFCLNETSALIYQLCNGKNSVAEISQALNKHLKQSISEDLVWLALNDFKKDNLLEESEKFEINFNGLSRRQVIRKIGFASLVMLPLIMGVTAPVAAASASYSCGNSCADSSVCTGGCLTCFGICSNGGSRCNVSISNCSTLADCTSDGMGGAICPLTNQACAGLGFQCFVFGTCQGPGTCQ